MEDRLIHLMESVGLTGYEARAYKALIEHGKLSANELSRSTGIPLQRVYGVISSLMNKGLVKELPEKPKKFDAVPPTEGLEEYVKKYLRSLENQLEHTRDISQELLKEVNMLYNSSRIKVGWETLIQKLSGFNEMEAATVKGINDATDMISISTNTFSWYPKVERYLKEALDKGVMVRVLLNPSIRRIVDIGIRFDERIRFRRSPKPALPFRGTIFDDKMVVFLMLVPSNESQKIRPLFYQPHISTNRGIVKLFSDTFEYNWVRGKNLK